MEMQNSSHPSAAGPKSENQENASAAANPSPVINNMSPQPDKTPTARKRTAPERPPKRSSAGTKHGKRRRRGCPKFTRRLWNDTEDEAIVTLVRQYGIKKWTLIAHKLQEQFHISGRSGKQCRERYTYEEA